MWLRCVRFDLGNKVHTSGFLCAKFLSALFKKVQAPQPPYSLHNYDQTPHNHSNHSHSNVEVIQDENMEYVNAYTNE